MTPEEFETCWIPIPLRWRNVVAGDVVFGGDEAWMAEFVELRTGGVKVQLSRGMAHQKGTRPSFTVDPDEVVQVLTPWPMAQAVALTRDELGARLLARRTTQEGAA